MVSYGLVTIKPLNSLSMVLTGKLGVLGLHFSNFISKMEDNSLETWRDAMQCNSAGVSRACPGSSHVGVAEVPVLEWHK